jgi:hypothetical protein
MSDERLRGEIRKVDGLRGFGFIRDENGQDYFVHVRDTTFCRDTEGTWSADLVGKAVMFSSRPSPSADRCPLAVAVVPVEP